MRQFALVAWMTLLAGCWLSYDAVDDTGDGDADADTDSDSDSDGDGDSDRPPNWWWPAQVCGLDPFSPSAGGTLRVMSMTCGSTISCSAAVVGDAIDLRPTSGPHGAADSGGSADCAPMPAWADCEIPPGNYSSLSVWGQHLYIPCFGGDTGDCEPPDCVQLPPEPLPDGCQLEPLFAEQVCGPVAEWLNQPVLFSVVNGCECPAEFRPGGCLSSNRNGAVRFAPLVAQCSECGDEDVCYSADTYCTLYEAPPGQTTVDFPAGTGSISFGVTIGDSASDVECHGYGEL